MALQLLDLAVWLTRRNMVDSRRVAPFPKSISLLSLSNSSLYNRRMASSKDNVAAVPQPRHDSNLLPEILDYEELEWKSVEKLPIANKSFPNYYGSDTRTRNINSNKKTGYTFVFALNLYNNVPIF